MSLRRKNNIITRIFFNQISLAVIGLTIIILISIPLAENIRKRYYINKEIRELENEIAEMQDKNLELVNFIEYLESDQYIEEQARLNLGLKKEGEEVVVIRDSNNYNQAGDSSDDPYGASIPEDTGNPRKWMRYFFN